MSLDGKRFYTAFSALDALALSMTDNEAVERVNKARTKLFDTIRLARKRA